MATFSPPPPPTAALPLDIDEELNREVTEAVSTVREAVKAICVGEEPENTVELVAACRKLGIDNAKLQSHVEVQRDWYASEEFQETYEQEQTDMNEECGKLYKEIPELAERLRVARNREMYLKNLLAGNRDRFRILKTFRGANPFLFHPDLTAAAKSNKPGVSLTDASHLAERMPGQLLDI